MSLASRSARVRTASISFSCRLTSRSRSATWVRTATWASFLVRTACSALAISSISGRVRRRCSTLASSASTSARSNSWRCTAGSAFTAVLPDFGRPEGPWVGAASGYVSVDVTPERGTDHARGLVAPQPFAGPVRAVDERGHVGARLQVFTGDVMPQVSGYVRVHAGPRRGAEQRVAGAPAHRDRPNETVWVAGGPDP